MPEVLSPLNDPMKNLLGLSLVVTASALLIGGWQGIAPLRHVFLVLNGTISPSVGNLGVVGGEVFIFVAVACASYFCLRIGYSLLDSDHNYH